MFQLTVIFILLLFVWPCSPRSAWRIQAPHLQGAASDRECHNTFNVLGFAVVSFDAATVVPFFADTDSSKRPVQIIRFYSDPSTNSLSFRVEGEESYSLLRPEAHKLDYFIFELPVRNRRSGWLEVVVDQQSGKTLWAQENQTVRFYDWMSTMQRAFAVERLEGKANPLRSEPTEDANEVKVIGRDCFKVSEMKGDWINVNQQSVCDGESISPASGWVR